jgi:type IV pilus assembly protein PilB
LGEKVVPRVLDPTTGLKSFEDLGLTHKDAKRIRKAIDNPYGLILSTGPTGSGKTTTLYAILQILNQEGVNIVTLEDPVEYFMKGIAQSQIRPEIGYSFARGLRHILRQDPDIVMVGEIRDKETASLVTHAALTGHLVLSTLHTSNSLGVIPRLVDLGIQPFLISPTLSLIIGQRLVRKLCNKCRKKTKASKEIETLILKAVAAFPEKIKKEVKVSKPLYVWEPKGCKYCSKDGFSGRIGIFEILEMTKELAEIILQDFSEKKIKEEANRQAMVTMRQDGILKIINGDTTVAEVLRATQDES